MRLHSRELVLLVALLLVGLVLSACESTSAPPSPTSKPEEKARPEAKAETKAQAGEPKAAQKDLPQGVGIGTHGVGGSFYAVGTGLAKVISDRSPIKAISKPTAGPNAYLPLLDTGELELAVPPANDAGWAFNGQMGYEKPYKSIRALVRGHQSPNIVLVVRADSGIKSIKDLRGKRVASDYGASQVVTQQVTAALASVGLTWNDVQPVPVTNTGSGIEALQMGRADATFGATPTAPQFNEINASVPLQALSFGDLPIEQADSAPKALVDTLQKYVPGATVYRQKKEGYLKSEVTGIMFATWLVASSKLGSDAAYVITRTVYENDKDLHPMHALLKDWKQETMFNPSSPAPYHDGAIRFWREKGFWTAEAEANQKKLLGQ